MAQLELGSIEVVDIRKLWEHEERDFTPWPEAHIDHLSSALGIQITIDSTEQRVGGYELDIMGHVEECDTVVIIENQLECTEPRTSGAAHHLRRRSRCGDCGLGRARGAGRTSVVY